MKLGFGYHINRLLNEVIFPFHFMSKKKLPKQGMGHMSRSIGV